MKYVKYILGLISILALIFIGNGFLNPSLSYTSEIIVDKPIKEAWAVMSDESKLDQWLKGLTKIEHISGERGGVGGVTKYTYVENGQESEIVETINAISPNESISMDFVMEDVMNMDYKVDFQRKDGKTQIKSSTTTEGIGIFMRSMLSFMKGSMLSQENENMGNLKKLIEANTSNYFPDTVVEELNELQE